MTFFSFLINALVNLEKLIRFHRQAFIIHKKWRKFENTETNVSPKTLVSNVILAFLDHLKSSSANHGGRHRADLQISGSASDKQQSQVLFRINRNISALFFVTHSKRNFAKSSQSLEIISFDIN